MTKEMKDYNWNADKSGRPTLYPWDEWTDGTARLAVKDEDFKIKSTSFRSTLRSTATHRGLKVRTRMHVNGIVFQFSDKEGNFRD